jgi:hypothetical protein
MGVKSTVHLTRAEAVKRAADLEEKQRRRAIEARFYAMTDADLEKVLETMNDEALGGEGFENYTII